MKFSDKRSTQIRDTQFGSRTSMSCENFIRTAVELFRKEQNTDDLEAFERWLSTDPEPDVSTLSPEDRLGYLAINSVPYNREYAQRAYFTDRDGADGRTIRREWNTIAKAVIDAYERS